jgi:hypothetical protein
MKNLSLVMASSIFALFVLEAHGFAAPKTSGLADEAVSIFQTAYPKKEPFKASAWTSFGVPGYDIDGTPIKKAKKGEEGRRRLTDISEKQCRASFKALAHVYGQDEALQMTRIMPIILSFDSQWFGPSYKEWSRIFGPDEAKAMVLRNPGLLAVRPENAATATDQTMNFSYIVAYTRPFSKVLLPGLLCLLAVPAMEAVTGVSIRASLFNF